MSQNLHNYSTFLLMGALIACGARMESTESVSSGQGGSGASATASGGAKAFAGGPSPSQGGAAAATGGTGGTAGTTTFATAVAPKICLSISIEAAAIPSPPILEFVLDNADSMNDATQPSTAGLSKWAALQNAFTSTITTLATDHPEYAVGLTYAHYRGYGSPGSPCTDAQQAVGIAPLSLNLAALVGNAQLEGTIAMKPLQDIWQFAADHALAWGATDAAYANSYRYVVVLTDGVPTVAAGCATAGGCLAPAGTSISIGLFEYQAFIDRVGEYKDLRNLTTFMIAVPGSEATSPATCPDGTLLYTPIAKMTEVAAAGGTELVDLTTSATNDFATPLISAIVEQYELTVPSFSSCYYAIPATATEPVTGAYFYDKKYVQVWYYENGSTPCSIDADCASSHCNTSTKANPGKCYRVIERSDDCSNADGWAYADAAQSAITLCSGACMTAQADADATLEIVLLCFPIG